MTRPGTAALLRTVAAHGLPSYSGTVPTAPAADDAWQDLLFGARSERIVALLARAVADGLVPASDTQIAEVVGLDMQAMASVLALEATLLRVADLLDEAEVPFRVLKGAAVAHLDYPDPALREFGDIDLLIRPIDLDRTIGLLARHGFTRRFPEPRPGFDRRFTKSVSVVDKGGLELDLHRTFAPGGFGLRVQPAALWDAPAASFAVGGRCLPALGLEERVVHACYHAVLGNSPPRLVPLRDIAELLLRGSPDPHRVRALAASWRGEAVVAHAIRTTWATLRLTEPVELSGWAASFIARPAERRELRRATSPTYSYPVQALDAVRAIQGPRSRLAYLSALAFPRRSYLRGRHTGLASRARYAIAELLGARTTTRWTMPDHNLADHASSVRRTEMSVSDSPTARAPLAVLGGDPQFPSGLPLTRVVIPDRERLSQRLEAIFDSGMLTSGPNVAELEERVADLLDVPHVVAVASCTTGLMLVLQAVDATGSVLMPSFTFAATAHAAAWAGGRPVFADVVANSLTLDPDDAAARLPGARALMATHVYGTPCDVEQLDKIAAAAEVPVIYDAAHALGSKRRGKAIGGFGTAEVFSLSPTKVAPAGEGGLVATHDAGVAEQVRLARNYGNPGDYDCRVAGLNARMSELHAAVGLATLTELPERVQRRNELVHVFVERLAGVPGIRLPEVDAADLSTYKDLTLIVDEQQYGLDVPGLNAALAAEGADCRRYFYPPVHRQRAYAHLGPPEELPVTDALAPRVLTLPLWTQMSDDTVRQLADLVIRCHESAAAVREALARAGRRRDSGQTSP